MPISVFDSRAPHIMDDTRVSTWMPGPDTRGTYNIAKLCVSTLLICAYNAVHVDVPPRKRTWAILAQRIGWLILSVFTPEIPVLAAFGQRAQARQLVRASRKYLQREWTMTQGFYAAMGGFVFETSTKSHGHFLPFASSRVPVTPEGVEFLMQYAPELIPNVSPDAIADRNKSSALTKCILCCQAVSFCALCVARVAQGLPLSLLEVTTLAHSLCALAAYVMWWHKPQDVQEPTVISGTEARKICALMVVASPVDRWLVFGTFMVRWRSELRRMFVQEQPQSSIERNLIRASSALPPTRR